MVGCKSAAMCAGANNFNQHQCVNMISITCLLASLAICSLSCYLSIRACRTSRLAARPWERRWRWSVSDQHRRLTRWWRSLPRVAWIQTRTRSALLWSNSNSNWELLEFAIDQIEDVSESSTLVTRNSPEDVSENEKQETPSTKWETLQLSTFERVLQSLTRSTREKEHTRYIITKHKSDHVHFTYFSLFLLIWAGFKSVRVYEYNM